MCDEYLKDIIIALINNEYFPKYSSNEAEHLGKDIAKFAKTFNKEVEQ